MNIFAHILLTKSNIVNDKWWSPFIIFFVRAFSSFLLHHHHKIILIMMRVSRLLLQQLLLKLIVIFFHLLFCCCNHQNKKNSWKAMQVCITMNKVRHRPSQPYRHVTSWKKARYNNECYIALLIPSLILFFLSVDRHHTTLKNLLCFWLANSSATLQPKVVVAFK